MTEDVSAGDEQAAAFAYGVKQGYINGACFVLGLLMGAVLL